MTNPLNNLVVDVWYKVFVAVGTIILVASIAAKDHGFAFVGLGIATIGVGEWKNHPERQILIPRGLATDIISDKRRRPSPFGLVLDGIGLLLIGIGFYRLL